MDVGHLKYWVAFNRVRGTGRARFQLLERKFGSMADAWTASQSDLVAAGLDAGAAQKMTASRASIDPDAEMLALEKAGVRALTWHDDEYPDRLKEVYDLPPVIYVRGHIEPGDERTVSLVGTRRPTAYGREAAHRMAFDLADAGVTVVSGLARGIDGVVHRAALEAKGRTIAVMGSGPDVVYPPEHKDLAAEVAKNGAVVSEHPLGVRPDARNFPRRNRIMSGMTMGTVVIEADVNSGALITARHALEQNREVFAVPGNVFSPSSRGANGLIRDSAAKLVMDHRDILEELNLSWVDRQMDLAAVFPQDQNESEVLRWVTYDPVHIDEIIRSSGLEISTVSSALAMMELRSLVKQVGGMNYIRLKETSAEYRTV